MVVDWRGGVTDAPLSAVGSFAPPLAAAGAGSAPRAKRSRAEGVLAATRG